MICDKCKDIIVIDEFKETNCIMCGEIITSSHLPPFKYCEECSINLNVCKQCGNDLED